MKIYIILFIIAALFSCQEAEDTKMKEATLRWTGPYAADGCGYFLTIDDTEYKPMNEAFMDEMFQQPEEMPVLVEYKDNKETRELQCGMRPETITKPVVEIISIKHRK